MNVLIGVGCIVLVGVVLLVVFILDRLDELDNLKYMVDVHYKEYAKTINKLGRRIGELENSPSYKAEKLNEQLNDIKSQIEEL